MKAQNALGIAKRAFLNARDPAAKVVAGATVDTQSKKIFINQENIEEMLQSLSSIGDLRSLVSEVHSNTLIRYRIYAESNESWLLLVDGEYAIPSLP